MAEVASGDHGHKSADQMAIIRRQSIQSHALDFESRPHTAYSKMTAKSKASNLSNIYLLTRRCFILTIREPQLFLIRLVVCVVFSLQVSLMFGPEAGIYAGCPSSMIDVRRSPKSIDQEKLALNYNISALFMYLLICLFSGIMPMIMTFPKEFSVVVKEHTNGWYSSLAYYLAKFLIEVPMSFASMIINFELTCTHERGYYELSPLLWNLG